MRGAGSTKALREVLLAWLEWPGRTPAMYQAFCEEGARDLEFAAMLSISGTLHARGWIDMNEGTITKRGREMIDQTPH